MTDDQFAVVVVLLTDIRDLLASGLQAAEESDECQHPEDQRVNLSTPSDPNHWICHACRFDNKVAAEPPMN